MKTHDRYYLGVESIDRGYFGAIEPKYPVNLLIYS